MLLNSLKDLGQSNTLNMNHSKDSDNCVEQTEWGEPTGPSKEPKYIKAYSENQL